MKKKLFGFNTKTLVGTALGAALFTVLFMYVKIPTGIPETQIQSATVSAASSQLCSAPSQVS